MITVAQRCVGVGAWVCVCVFVCVCVGGGGMHSGSRYQSLTSQSAEGGGHCMLVGVCFE